MLYPAVSMTSAEYCGQQDDCFMENCPSGYTINCLDTVCTCELEQTGRHHWNAQHSHQTDLQMKSPENSLRENVPMCDPRTSTCVLKM